MKLKHLTLARDELCGLLAASCLALAYVAAPALLSAEQPPTGPPVSAPPRPNAQGTLSPEAAEAAQYAILQAFAVLQEAKIEAQQTEVRRLRGDRKEAEARAKEEEIETLKDEIVARFLTFAIKYSKNSQVYNELGLIVFDLARPHEAARYWEHAIGRNPDYADAHNNLGSYYSKFGDPVGAFREYDRAIELDPNKAVYHLNRATELYTAREPAALIYGWDLARIYEEVMKEHKLARDLAPDNYNYARQYAETFMGAKFFGLAPDWKATLEAWQHCLKLNISAEERDQVHMQLVRTHLSLGDKASAREALSHVTTYKGGAQYEALRKRAYSETDP